MAGEVEVAGGPAPQAPPLARLAVGALEVAAQLHEAADRQLGQQRGLALVVVVHRRGGDAARAASARRFSCLRPPSSSMVARLADEAAAAGLRRGSGVLRTSTPSLRLIPARDHHRHTVEIPVQGLTANTTYHFRVVATSDGGTVQGADATLKTDAVPTAPTRPAVTTGGVRDAAMASATLTAAVNPHGENTSYKLRMGDQLVARGEHAGRGRRSGTRSLSVTARIAGLAAGKRYYYRVVASNSLGTTRGSTRSFVTASTPTSAGLSADRDPVPYGTPVKLSGKLGGSKLGNVRVRLQTTPFPFSAPFADTGNAVRSSSSGAYSFSLPAVTTTLRALVVVDGLPSFFSKPIVVRSAARGHHVADAPRRRARDRPRPRDPGDGSRGCRAAAPERGGQVAAAAPCARRRRRALLGDAAGP